MASIDHEDPKALAEKFSSQLNSLSRGQVDVEYFVSECLYGLLSGNHVIANYEFGARLANVARNFADRFSLYFREYPFTADLMPYQLLGNEVFEGSLERTYAFQPGPIFANVFFASDVNWASPRLQSALLHVMRDRKIIVEHHEIPQLVPFCVVASRCTATDDGVYELPKAQIEEFGLSLLVRGDFGLYFDDQISQGVERLEKAHVLRAIETTMRLPFSKSATAYLDRFAERFSIGPKGLPTIQQIVTSGASGLGLRSARRYAQAVAFMEGSGSVSVAHMEKALRATMPHRIDLTFTARTESRTVEDVMDILLGSQ